MCQEFVPRQLTQEWREQYYASHSQAPIDEELFECMMLETYARERVKELVEALQLVMNKANEFDNGSTWRAFADSPRGGIKLGIYLSFAELKEIEVALARAKGGRTTCGIR